MLLTMFAPKVEAVILFSVKNADVSEYANIFNIIAAGIVAFLSAHLYWRAQYKKLKNAMDLKKVADYNNAFAAASNFSDFFDCAWEEARRDNSALALFIVGINNFKEYNSMYGKAEAFNCLSTVSGVLMDTIRGRDHVAIYEREEIAIVLPRTDPKAMNIIAERIFSNIREKNIPHASSETSYVTVSIGCMTCRPSAYEMDKDDFVQKADLALCTAMQSGCGRLEIHPEAER